MLKTETLLKIIKYKIKNVTINRYHHFTINYKFQNIVLIN